MNSPSCGLIQETAFNALLGDEPTHVAMFGNSDVNKVDDWVKIINNKPSNEVGGLQHHLCEPTVKVVYPCSGPADVRLGEVIQRFLVGNALFKRVIRRYYHQGSSPLPGELSLFLLHLVLVIKYGWGLIVHHRHRRSVCLLRT